MKIVSSYSVRLGAVPVNLADTLGKYRGAVDFYIRLIDTRWDRFSECGEPQAAMRLAERLSVPTAKRPEVECDFSSEFYKFPSYLRRSAIADAYGKVSSYRSNLARWENEDPSSRGKRPSAPQAGYSFPAMYKDNCFVRTGTYSARLKVWMRNTWDWIDVALRKCDADYITRRCANRKECVPTLCRRGKVWSLDFPFEENVKLPEQKSIYETRIVSVDLGINSACVCSVMEPDGTVVGRRFLRLRSENDRLEHALDRIVDAQRAGARRMPRLWARAKGLNDDIAVKTARFIVDTAVMYDADVIVMEALDLQGKKRGSKRRRLHHWRSQYVQSMVEHKAHRMKIRISRVCAWNTSRLAFDGSGEVRRGDESERTAGKYSLCEFATGKLYNCDLNASYNIGARYFIREILRPLPAREKERATAKVPSLGKRSTCTLSDLKGLRAVLAASAAGRLSV